MIVYSPSINNRLKYVISYIGQQLTGSPLILTANRTQFLSHEGIKIAYTGEEIPGCSLWIRANGFLEEEGIHQQNISCFEFNGSKAFFKTNGGYPFDIFSAIFYLLSRYEEYIPHKKDAYGRYAHTNSLAFREGFLQQPLVNIWLKDLASHLVTKGYIEEKTGLSFSFVPTYDIDEAYSYSHKQWWRRRGGAIRDLLKGSRDQYKERKKVLAGKLKDPFDAYDWMDKLHQDHVLHPHYFFLVADKTSKFDKNILPSSPAMQELITRHAAKYSLGIHPSWQSYNNAAVLKSEIETLEKLSGQKIISSRQHFIKMNIPETYRLLLDLGILKDFSMGYGSINGFRASVATPFYWYDLGKEEQTQLMIYPFCFMEANSFFEQKQTAEESLAELKYYYKTVKEADGMMVTIFHNTFLGTDPMFSGWKEMYREFIEGL
jgi:hypothetical protein